MAFLLVTAFIYLLGKIITHCVGSALAVSELFLEDDDGFASNDGALS